MTDHQAEILAASILRGFKMLSRAIIVTSCIRSIEKGVTLPDSVYANLFRAIEVGVPPTPEPQK